MPKDRVFGGALGASVNGGSERETTRRRFVVARWNPKLYEFLKGELASAGGVEVILDRCRGERRRVGRPDGPERRSGNRRIPSSADEDLRAHGLALVDLESR